MKNKLKIMGLIFMLVLANVVVCFAGTATLTANISSTEVKAGETFTIALNAKSEDGINGISGSYTYDEEKLELVSTKVNENFANLGSGSEIAMISNATTSIKDADLLTFEFRIKAGVEAGSVVKVNFGETVLDTEAESDSYHTIEAFEVSVKVKEETPPQPECNHENTNKTDNGNGTHSEKCAKCGEVVKTENHTYKDGKCSCGAKQQVEEPCNHPSASAKYTDNGNGTHTLKCGKCGEVLDSEQHNYKDGKCSACGAKEPVQECEHTWREYKDLKDGRHSSSCTKCGETKKDVHTYENGKCSACGAKEPVQECEHTWGEYQDLEDGWHSQTCTKCEETRCDVHTYKDGKCNACGSVEPSVEQPSTENKDQGKKDETTVNKEIPKAGLNTMLVFVMAVIAMVALIMHNKNKKYEDIR